MSNKNYKKRDGRSRSGKKKCDDLGNDNGNHYSRSDGGRSSGRRADKYDAPGSNSPMWYAHNEQLLRDSASISFSWPTGNNLPITNPEDFKVRSNSQIRKISSPYNNVGIPGIMALSICPTIGCSIDENSPVNVAARNIYSFVRHANSGKSNYEAADLMMYLLAMDSLYSMLAWAQRAYGLMTLYSPTNRYYPKAIVNASGFDFDDLIANLANFRYFINSITVKIGSLCVPATMPYHQRHVQMYQSVYLDDQTQKSQTYLYKPSGFYRFNPYDGAGKLVFEKLADKITYQEFIEYANNMINAVMRNEDMNIMSGDILKAYGDRIVKLSSITEDFVVQPVYNTEMLTQIQNASIIDDVDYTRLDITQNVEVGLGGPIIYVPTLISEGSYIYNQNSRLISFNFENVQPADVMVATRLCAITGEPLKVGDTTAVTTVGSEFVDGAKLWYYNYEVNDTRYIPVLQSESLHGCHILSFESNSEAAAQAASKVLSFYGMLSQFKYHPLVLTGTSFADSDPEVGGTHVIIGRPIFEVNNYAVVDRHTLDKMHDTALLSEFNITSSALK